MEESSDLSMSDDFIEQYLILLSGVDLELDWWRM